MKKKKNKLVFRRKLNISDYRNTNSARQNLQLIKVGEHGYIDVAGMKKTFPNKYDRLRYISSLIEGMK